MKYNKQISLGYDVNGVRIRKWIHANTIAELQKKSEQLRREFEETPNTSDITFREYAAQWNTAYKANRSGKTREMYAYALKKCEPLARIPLKSVTKTACQQIVNALWKTPRTAKIVRGTLSQIFRAAVADGIILRNPADNLTVPDQKRTEKHLLTPAEIDAVRRAELDPQDRLFVDLLLIFGLRPAEALALQWSDFDFKKKVLTISHALEMTNDNKSRLKDTKTGVTRRIPIPDEIIPRLRAEFRSNSRFLLFAKKDNGLMTKSAYRRMSERILGAVNTALGGDETMNLTFSMSLYSFRHYRATELYYLCQQGVISTKYAAEILGHSEEVFLRIYSHVDENKERTAEIYPEIRKMVL